jgi:hypothetical protein
MFHWNPAADHIQEWTPVGGWNRSCSEADKIQTTALFFFYKNKKGYAEEKASILAHMRMFKQKYRGLTYSEEQEALL